MSNEENQEKGIPRKNTSSEYDLDIYTSSFVIYVSSMEKLFGKAAKVKAQVTAQRKNMFESFEEISQGWIEFPGNINVLIQGDRPAEVGLPSSFLCYLLFFLSHISFCHSSVNFL